MACCSVCLANDRLLVVGYTSANVAVFDVDTGAPMNELVTSAAGGLSFAYAMLRSDDRLLVASWGNNSVFEFDIATGTFVRVLIVSQPGGFNLPAGMVFSNGGTLYVSSANTDAIVEFDRNTGAQLGVFADASDGLDEPDAMMWHNGRLLVCSRANNRIFSFDSAGNSAGPLVWNDPATPEDDTGGLQAPRGLAVTADGRLLVSSSANHRVIAYDVNSGALLGTLIAAGAGGLNDPRGIAVRHNQEILVASSATSNVKRYSSTGSPLGDLAPPFAGGLAHPTQLVLEEEAPPGTPGDMNCDGVLSVGDISGFVLALTNPAGYAAAFPNCDAAQADLNQDGNVSVGDIGFFVAALTR